MLKNFDSILIPLDNPVQTVRWGYIAERLSLPTRLDGHLMPGKRASIVANIANAYVYQTEVGNLYVCRVMVCEEEYMYLQRYRTLGIASENRFTQHFI